MMRFNSANMISNGMLDSRYADLAYLAAHISGESVSQGS